jgi:hypothetical protein
MLFDTQNQEHKAQLAAILRARGVLPQNPALATQVKEALSGTALADMEAEVAKLVPTAPVASTPKPFGGGLVVRSGLQRSGWMICLYGMPGVGKSTLASLAPRPIFADVEAGVARIQCESIACENWLTLEKILGGFASSDYQTLVLDTADVAEKKGWQHLCAVNKWRSIESPGFGRGYNESLELWTAFLEKCRALTLKGKNIIFTAHSEVRTYLNPEGESYDRHNMKLHNKISEHFFGQMDGVFFCHFDSTVKKNSGGDMIALATGERLISCSSTLIAQVKNRFGIEGKVALDADFFGLLR